MYTIPGSFLDDHGDRGFTTVFAVVNARDTGFRRSRETSRLEWIRRDRAATLDLRPGLAATWNELVHVVLGRYS